MINEELNQLNEIIASLSPSAPISHNSAQMEPFTYHRRGQWFKSSTAHHLENIISLIQTKSSL